MTEHRPFPLSRRRLLGGAGKAAAAGLLAPALAAPLLSRPAFAATGATNAAGGILKVGDQRSTIRSLLEASGQLKDIPYTLEFADFPAAAPVLEALNAGAIDAGFAGDAAHAFALSNGLPAKIISAARSDPGCIGLLVRKDSPIRTVADLKGRTITAVRGSIGHYLVVAALKANGLSVNDVTLAFLQATEAKSAFSSGTVDAWAIWTLYVAQEVVAGTGRVLVDGRGLLNNNAFISATDVAIAQKRPLLQDYVARVAAARIWALGNVEQYVRIWGDLVKVTPEIAVAAFKLERFRPVAVDDGIVADLQTTADFYTGIGVIQKPFTAAAHADRSFALDAGLLAQSARAG